MTSNIYVFDNSQEMKDHMASPQTRTREDKKVRQVLYSTFLFSLLLFFGHKPDKMKIMLNGSTVNLPK